MIARKVGTIMHIRPPRLSEVMETAAALSGILIVACIITVLWWMKPSAVMEITKLQVPESVYKPGDLLVYQMAYCKYDKTEADVHISWNDGISYPMPGATMRTLDLGCHVVKESITVPKLPPGMYRLEMIRIYQPTPLRKHEARALSNQFNVVTQ